MSTSATEKNHEAKTQAQANLQAGFQELKVGNFNGADHLFAKAYELDPKNIDTLNLLGIRAYQKQNWRLALTWLDQANQMRHDDPQTLNNLGLTYLAIGDNKTALEHFDLAIANDPNIPEIYNNRGNALKALKRNVLALDAFAKALGLRPNYAEANNNQGVIFLESGDVESAIGHFKSAVKVNPQFPEAHNNLGNAFTELGQYELAFQSFEKALRLNPNYLEASLNFGSSLKKAKQYEAAIQCYKHALTLGQLNGEIHYLIGEVYYDIGNFDLSKKYYSQACALDDQNTVFKFALAISQIAKVYWDADESLVSRTSFINQLKLLTDTTALMETDLEKISKIISRHPFYLAYHEDDNKALLSEFGLLCEMHAKRIQPDNREPTLRPANDKKISLGIVSNYFYDHPVWHAITKGFVKHLDTSRFEVHIFNTNGIEDDETILAKSKAKNYLNHKGSLNELARIILDTDLDALFFPEIGMDGTSKGLACLRLAPIQIASWGHPETTGLSTVDFFISSQNIEPPNCQKNYSEAIVLLPKLGSYFEWDSVKAAEINLNHLNLDGDIPIMLCAGSPSKYSPRNDYVFIEIAKQLKSCQFVFFTFQSNLSAILHARLNQVFLNANLSPENFIRFIPFQTKQEFYGLMLKSTLFLDTIGFSGFNTIMQAISCELPVVTIEGKFMRGRFGSAILDSMNLGKFSCKTNEDYIDRVVQLIRDKSYYILYKELIAASKMHLFEDTSPIRAFEAFLEKNI